MSRSTKVTGAIGALFLFLSVFLCACAAPPPAIKGEQLDQLKQALKKRNVQPTVIEYLHPPSYFGAGSGGLLKMEYQGKNRTERFNLYNGYFKIMFTVCDELRFLGIPCTINRDILDKRRDDLIDVMKRASLNSLNDQIRLYRLIETYGPGIFRWSRAKKSEAIALHWLRSLVKGALPPHQRGKRMTDKEIIREYFTPDPENENQWVLSLEAQFLQARAVEGYLRSYREGTADIHYTLSNLLTKELLTATRKTAHARIDGSGVIETPRGVTFSSTADEDVADIAIRQTVRKMVRELINILEETPPAGSPDDPKATVG